MHAPSEHLAKPAMHGTAVAHAPAEHTWPLGHARPHEPQLFASRCTSMHAPPEHIVKPAMHGPAVAHAPAEHT